MHSNPTPSDSYSADLTDMDSADWPGGPPALPFFNDASLRLLPGAGGLDWAMTDEVQSGAPPLLPPGSPAKGGAAAAAAGSAGESEPTRWRCLDASHPPSCPKCVRLRRALAGGARWKGVP